MTPPSRSKRPSSSAAAAPRYKPHPLLEDERGLRNRIAKETGRRYAEWVELGRTEGPQERRELERWYQTRHGMKPMASQWLAHSVLSGETGDESEYADPVALVDALYSGPKAALRPLHEAVVDVLVSLGEDVTVTSCKTMVPAYRKHVFAELAPAADGVTVQLALGDVPTTKRLVAAAGRQPGDRLTHAVFVRAKKDVDADLKTWIRQAYELGAGKLTRSTSFEVPASFAKAVERSKTAAATWAAMTPAMQRDMVLWVTSAKQADTRSRRETTALSKLAEGKRRVY